MNEQYGEIRTICRTMYDYQKLRIAIYNRIVSKDYLENTELKEDKKLTDKEKTALRAKLIKSMIEWYEDYHVEIENAKTLSSLQKNFLRLSRETKAPIKDFITYNMVKDYLLLGAREKEVQGTLALALKGIPIYEEFLKDAPGVGPVLSGIIISEFDVHKAPHVSCFWGYAGIDVWENPETGERVGRNNHSEQLIDREYIDKKGEKKTKKSVTYNPFVRAKILGVLGDSFVKHGKKYREVYDRAKYKYENYREGWNKVRIHRAAIRVATREFLRDLWTKWRELEGYPPEEDWNEANRKRMHGESLAPEDVKVDGNGDLLPPDIDREYSLEELDKLS